jgi:hypothetical protein
VKQARQVEAELLAEIAAGQQDKTIAELIDHWLERGPRAAQEHQRINDSGH